ncbi:MAG: trypsin-like peptidase domain-containing protein [Anaerolineales bacterium]|nr:trypsin-like peptidase domain-containing protein [Anaerolineales bacterium]
MISSRNKNSTWLAGCLVVAICLLIGAAIGSLAGYVVAARVLGPVAAAGPGSALVQPVPAGLIVSTPSNSAGSAPQEIIINDQSSSVGAVAQVLPAVVTVIAQDLRGIGSGSGVFISSDGYVVTNNHVVEGAGELLVIYAQGGRAPAKLVGTAPDFDLAVLKVEGLAPGVAVWGDSSELPLGAHVLAIGSALGEYQNTVTSGVLSGFNRELGGLRGLLQTDAAINSGNSGGPLINLAGQIVGINTAVVRGDGFSAGAEGLGFAIPSNVAEKVVQRLIESGDARPSFLGIQYKDLNPQLANEQQLTITQGALLEEVVNGSPAALAGLQAGDVIVGVNGQVLDDRHPLVSLLVEYVAGETITLDIQRAGQMFQTQLTLGERA